MARRAPGRSVSLLVGLALAASFVSSAEASADVCATSRRAAGLTEHIKLWLTGMHADATATHPFYFAPEDAPSGRFQVIAGAHVCAESASVRFSTAAGTALPSDDFEAVTGRAMFTIVHTTDPWRVDVPLVDDGLKERAVETFRVSLSRPQNGSLRAPSEAPFHVVDVDGADRATLDAEPYVVNEADGVIHVAVFRAGPATSSLSVPYTVAGSGMQPATDADFDVVSPNPLTFGSGERVGFVEIALADDGVDEPNETLLVSLIDPAPDAVAETTTTIGGEIDASPPRSRFHHPRMDWTYASDDYRIREMHVFTGDGEGSGVVRMDLALRRNAKDGTCAWWNGRRFDGGDCSEPRWARIRAYEAGSFYFYRIDPLSPSVGTRIRSYTALARATDAAGNVEDLIEGKNANTFEVTRR